jgi:hypothetical protein
MLSVAAGAMITIRSDVLPNPAGRNAVTLPLRRTHAEARTALDALHEHPDVAHLVI